MIRTIKIKKHGYSTTSLILTLVLLSIVVTIISAVNIKSIKNWSHQSGKIILSQDRVAECCAQCAMCLKVNKSECTCNIEGKVYSCDKECGKGEWGGIGESKKGEAINKEKEEKDELNNNPISIPEYNEEEIEFLPPAMLEEESTECEVIYPYSSIDPSLSRRECVDEILANPQITSYIQEASDKYDINECLLISIMSVESCGKNRGMYRYKNIIRPSYGIMQISMQDYRTLIHKHKDILEKEFPHLSLDKEHIITNLQNDRFSIHLAALLLRDKKDRVKKAVDEYKYSTLRFKNKEDEEIAFYGAIYNTLPNYRNEILKESSHCISQHYHGGVPRALCKCDQEGVTLIQDYIPILLDTYHYCLSKRSPSTEKKNIFLPVSQITAEGSEMTRCKLLDPTNMENNPLTSKKECIDKIWEDEELRNNIKEMAEDYLGNELQRYNINRYCLLISIMSVESCGNKYTTWNNIKEKSSYGIMQINKDIYCNLIGNHYDEIKEKYPEITGIEDLGCKKEGNKYILTNEEKMKESLRKARFSILLSSLLLKHNLRGIENKIEEQKYDYSSLGFESKEDEIVAFEGAVYNGGTQTLEKSNDCNPEKCKEITFNVPQVLCAYNPGEYLETQRYIPTLLEAYHYCKNKIKD